MKIKDHLRVTFSNMWKSNPRCLSALPGVSFWVYEYQYVLSVVLFNLALHFHLRRWNDRPL